MVKIPAEIPNIFNQAQFMADRHIAEGRGGRVAIYYNDSKITYNELVAKANRTGNALKTLGVEMENRVLIILNDSPEFFYCYLGAMKIGTIPIPVNTLASSSDYEYFLNDSRAKVLVVAQSLLPKIDALKGKLKYLRHIVVVGEAPSGALSYDKLVAAASDTLEHAETSKDDMAFWMYTSGTTGQPKGVVHLHHDLLFYEPPVVNVMAAGENDIVFVTSKMFFSYGRNNSLEVPLLTGAAVVLSPGWPNVQEVLAMIEKYRPTMFFSVPSFYSQILLEIEKSGRKYDLSSIRLCSSAGEALPKHLYERWEARFGLQILEGLGSTDVGGNYLNNFPGKVKPGSTGQLLDGFEAKLLDADGVEVATGEVGTLWLKNDGVTPGYWNKHQRNKEVIKGEWFNTGDEFAKDADGYYWFQGREDDMLKVSGQWVSPIEIEGALLRHECVRECGVVGAPDDAGLVKVKAFVVLKEGYKASAALEKEIATFVHDRIAHFKTPRWVVFTTDMPRTVTGKLKRHELRKRKE